MAAGIKVYITNTTFNQLGYIEAGTNLKEKHDRSAPSDFHWKILKCRMMIFSNTDILVGPDEKDIKKIHIIFSKVGGDFNNVKLLLTKFSLVQEGDIKSVNNEVYHLCLRYTIIAKMAPVWNILGSTYLINNRNFLTEKGPQQAVQFELEITERHACLRLKPVKITIIRDGNVLYPGECVRVFPSLNKGTLEEVCDKLPESAKFQSYKDIKRHWKNIHGYRLPETEGCYYLIRFWRGDPLTYPKICVTSQYPIIIPMKKSEEKEVIVNFLKDFKKKIPNIIRKPTAHQCDCLEDAEFEPSTTQTQLTQAVSLCTPTQNQRKRKID